MQLLNKTAVISGAASGLGRCTAEHLVAAGVKVVLLDLDSEAGEQAAKTLGKENALFIQTDIRSPDEVAEALNVAVQTFSAIHICISCAGIAPAQKMMDRDGNANSLETFQHALDINLLGAFNLSRLAAEKMIKHAVEENSEERGIIVHTASIAAYEGQIGQNAYAASKAGVVGLVLPMARELAKWGIRVNAIAPGIMNTPMMQSMPQNVQDGLSTNVPFPKRMGQADEFAALVLHMIENAYLNGEVVRLDGAIRMTAK